MNMKPLLLRDATAMTEGEGAEVRRLFPLPGFMNFDPFVLWDHFSLLPGTGFPDHPHRGFEAITYVFEGGMQHRDNLGNASRVQAGGLQRFTAGSGIVHSEMPAADATTRGIQLWINLPQSLKRLAPGYQQVDAAEVPELSIDGGSMRQLVGEQSPLQLHTPVHYADVQLAAGHSWRSAMPADFRGFVYLVAGRASCNGHELVPGAALFYPQAPSIEAAALDDCRFMVCFGRPHGEPINQHGSFVD